MILKLIAINKHVKTARTILKKKRKGGKLAWPDAMSKLHLLGEKGDPPWVQALVCYVLYPNTHNSAWAVNIVGNEWMKELMNEWMTKFPWMQRYSNTSFLSGTKDGAIRNKVAVVSSPDCTWTLLVWILAPLLASWVFLDEFRNLLVPQFPHL